MLSNRACTIRQHHSCSKKHVCIEYWLIKIVKGGRGGLVLCGSDVFEYLRSWMVRCGRMMKHELRMRSVVGLGM